MIPDPHVSMFAWLAPAVMAMLLYGLGQGLVKQWIGEVSAPRYGLYYIGATSLVNVGFFLAHDHASLFGESAHAFLLTGTLAYLVDGTAWILYFESIAAGPVAIVGTLSAAYPALTVIFARFFLDEHLTSLQYVAVTLVIGGCIGLSYAPAGAEASRNRHRWIPLALAALLCWGTSNTLIKYAYGLPSASEVSMALCSTAGGMCTLGVYGLLRSRNTPHTLKAWMHSLVPMGMMAGGSLGIIIAARYGQISIVTPLIGAYPVVTVLYAALVLKEQVTRLQYLCIAGILAGILLCPAGA